MDFRPALRPDLGRVTGEDGALLALLDPLLDRRVNLGPVSRAVASRLDGQHTVAEIIAAVHAEDLARSAEEVERALRALLLMNLVEDAGAWILERAREVRGGAPLPILVPEGTRFGCQGSGDCCQSYSLGPLLDEDVARLQALAPRIAEALPELGPGPYLEERRAVDGPPRYYLRSVAQRCLFLLPSARCGLHAAFGADAKPGFCRLYPYQDQPTLLGLKLYDRGECASFAWSARSGPYLVEDLDRVMRLLPAPGEIQHPLVFLDEETPCDAGHVLRLQEALAALTLRPLGAVEALQAVGGLMWSFVEALRACPLEAGEPDRTVAAVLAAGPPPAPQPDGAEAARGRGALATVAADLLDEIAPSMALADYNPGYPFHFRRLRDLDRALRRLLEREERAGGAQRPRRALAVLGAPGDEDADAAALLRDEGELWRTSLRQQVFGRQLLIADRLAPGLLRILMIYAVATAFAEIAAADRGARRPGLRDWSAGHALALRSLTQPNLERIFLHRGPLAWELLAALPRLGACALHADPASG